MDDVERELPLKPVDLHILMVLAAGPRHGYGMVKEIEGRSEGRLRLEPGNLYRYLRRLVDAGIVRPVPPPGGEGERRRDYEITRFGRRVLAAEARRMGEMAAVAASLAVERP